MKRTMRSKFLCWVCVCFGMILFLVSPATADWTDPDLETLLPVTPSIFVQTIRCSDPGSPCFDEDDPFRGPQMLDVIGDDIDVYLYEAVEVGVTIEVTDNMPLPIQVRVVLGGPGYQSAPRTWTVHSQGIYSTKAHFLASSLGPKQAGAKVWVKWDPDGQCEDESCDAPYKLDNTLILNPVNVTTNPL